MCNELGDHFMQMCEFDFCYKNNFLVQTSQLFYGVTYPEVFGTIPTNI